MNILYVKLFQAIVLHNQIIDEEMNHELMNFTDQAPWNFDDIHLESLSNLAVNHKIYLQNGFYNPINAGMISLVYKTYCEKREKYIIIKIKRKNIDIKLKLAIDQFLFLLYFLSFFPILKQYNLHELIQKNIDIIQHQICFQEEVDNIIRIKENCKFLKYVKIPEVYPEFTREDPNLIVMEFIEGMKIKDVLEEDREIFAKQLLKFGFVTTLMHGFTHGDLHAGNILFIKDSSNDSIKESHSFIKDSSNDSIKESHTKDSYKVGILDFGIMYPINDHFKNTLFEVTTDLFSEPPEVIAKKMLHSGIIIQPLEVIEALKKDHYQSILDIMTFAFNETLHRNKDGNQIRLYEFIHHLHSYLKTNSLQSLGLYLSDDFVKIQLVLAMAHGVTMKLCKEKYIELADRVINELFHTDLLL
jgi:predicted unusual protein kinase regulating ubiquinone biosynthesis (AarF/ABC1/UbiB family)